jgi:transcription elongation factor
MFEFDDLKVMTDGQLITLKGQIDVVLRRRSIGVRPFADGDDVRVLSGELKGHVGHVVKVKQANAIVSVNDEVIDISMDLLEKVGK